MDFPSLAVPRARHWIRFPLAGCAIAMLLGQAATAQPPGEIYRFNIPAQRAESALKLFSAQSGAGVIMNADIVEGVRTNPVSGQFTAQEALERLLAQTGLIGTANERSDAFVVHRTDSPRPPPVSSLSESTSPDTEPAPRAMKTKKPAIPSKIVALLTGWLALASAPGVSGQTTDPAGAAQDAGAISGRVLNATNGSYLENARVTIPGTRLVAFTDSSGEYRFAGVRAGQVQVTAFHTGLAGQTATVTVTVGQTTRQDFSLQATEDRDGVVTLGAYVVSTSKEMDGAAIAINERRFAPNVKDVVAADEFGAMNDGNVGEMLKFVPGVTLSYIGGEPGQISLDGVPADNVPITVGGFDLASARINTRRAVELTQFSVNNVARIEVSHTPTPEISGAALAGSINMVPRSAFERATPRLDVSASLTMHERFRSLRKTPGPLFDPTRKMLPSLNFSYLKPVNERFGFTISGATSAQFVSADWMQNIRRGLSDPTNGTTFPDTTPDKPYLTRYDVRSGMFLTRRSSVGATLDFKLSPNDSVSVSLQYSYFSQLVGYHVQRYEVTRVLPGNFSLTSTRGTGTLTTTDVDDDKAGTTYMPSITYRHRGPVWKAEAGAGLSHSTNVFANFSKGFFRFSSRQRTGLNIAFDDISHLRPGTITIADTATGAPIDPNNINVANLSGVQSASYQAASLQRSAYANVHRDFFGRLPLSLKAGVDVRQAARDLNRLHTPIYNFVGADGILNSADDGAAVVLDRSRSQLPMPYGFPRADRIDNRALFELFKAHPGYFALDEVYAYNTQVTASKYAEEIVSSAYLRGDTQFFQQRLKLVGGVRAEQTNAKGEGLLTDRTRNQRRDANGQVILDASGRPIPITTSALETAKLTNIERGLRAEKEYLRWFPSLNASFDVQPDLIARVGHYWSIGRPNLAQYAGTLTLPDTGSPPSSSNRFAVNNAGIKAWKARSTKATLEYYFGRVGLVSIGAFRRDIDNFFISSVIRVTPEFLALYGLRGEDYDGYEVSTQINSPDKVRMEGYNLSYKQALTFLPGWARGVQVFANFSAVRATGEGANNFTGYVPRTVNWGLSLSRPKYSFKVNWNHRERARSSVITGRSIEPGTYGWDGQRMYVDASADFSISKRLAVFVSARNLTDAMIDYEMAGPSTPERFQLYNREDHGAAYVFGLKGTF